MCRYHNSPVACAPSPYRLPRNVLPSKYRIILSPDLGNFTFSGQTVTDVNVLEPVKQIVLNAMDIEIQTAMVLSKVNGQNYQGTVSIDPRSERATIEFEETIPAGEATLYLEFTGTLNDKLKGFYRSKYKGPNGEDKYLASTQFEATDARRAFPCWDEPDIKANYQVSLLIDADLKAVSNTRIVREDPQSGAGGKAYKLVEFAETIKMSTYLVAFAVGEFECTEPIDVDGVAVRVHTLPGKKHLANFALEAAAFGLRYYSNYFKIPYMGDKIDLVAIPDFSAGAMENFGCITFRESALLVDEKAATANELSWVAAVVQHELAHMWFGDYVTMKWWTGLWLNEAFATFMQMKCTDAFRPEWKVWNVFGVSRSGAMRIDALGNTRPVEFTVVSPAEAQAMFDVLTYQKGAAVLRQLEQHIGETVFRNGIRRYLVAHAYGNAETADLWQALEASSRQPVGQIMEGWIFKSGFPLISVNETHHAGVVTITQQPFKFLPEAVTDQEQLWQIPVQLRRKGARTSTRKLLLTSRKISVDLRKGLKSVVMNAEGYGFHRVRYSARLLRKLTRQLNRLSVIERYNLVNDTWSCVRAGLAPITEYLSLIKLFGGETDPTVWGIITGSLSVIEDVLPEAQKAAFRSFVHQLVRPAFDRLGYVSKNGETSQTRQLRGSLLSTLAAIAEDGEAQGMARGLFACYQEDNSATDPDLLAAAVGIVAYTGGQAEYDEFLQLFKSSATPQEEQRYLYALTYFRNPALLSKTLEFCLNGTIRTQNAPFVVAQVMRNSVASELAWQFVKNNWDKLVNAYPTSGIVSMCSGITALDTPQLEADVRDFFARIKVESGEKAVAQYLELLRINVNFNQQYAAPLAEHFANAR